MLQDKNIWQCNPYLKHLLFLVYQGNRTNLNRIYYSESNILSVLGFPRLTSNMDFALVLSLFRVVWEVVWFRLLFDHQYMTDPQTIKIHTRAITVPIIIPWLWFPLSLIFGFGDEPVVCFPFVSLPEMV